MYPDIISVAHEIDVDALTDEGCFLLGWLGVSDDEHMSEITASPLFSSLDQLDVKQRAIFTAEQHPTNSDNHVHK